MLQFPVPSSQPFRMPMMNPPLSKAITTAMVALVPASLIVPAYAADESTSSRPARMQYTTETVVSRELERRQEYLHMGLAAREEGDRAMKAHDYAKAFAQYKQA